MHALLLWTNGTIFAWNKCYIFANFTQALTYLRKANETNIPTISCPFVNTVNFSRTSQIHFCAKNMSFCPFKPMGVQMPKNPPNNPFPLVMWTPSSTSMTGATPLITPNDSSISSCTSTQLCNEVPISYNGTPKIHPFPFDDHHPYLMHPSLDQPHSPSPTGFGSTQLFCHSTLSRHTDRPTDRWSRRKLRNTTAYARLIESDALI